MKDTIHFKAREFECKCGCGGNEMHQEVVDKLEQARQLAGVPFVINSGYRCAKHNKKVGGVPGSSHTLGWAVDIKAKDGASRYHIVSALTTVGFTRIGIDKSFIHVDMDPSKPTPTIWLY